MEPGDRKARGGVARFGPYEADFARHELRKNGTRINLQDLPFKLLRVLLENQDKIVTREELRHYLWPTDIFVKFDSCLNTALNKLRHALGEDPDRAVFIETIPREGYRFIAPVSWTSELVSSEASPSNGQLHSPAAEPRAILPQGLLIRYGFRRVAALVLLVLTVLAVALVFFRPNFGGPAHNGIAKGKEGGVSHRDGPGDGEEESDRGYTLGVSSPTCAYCPLPVYPDEARQAKLQGTVTLRVKVGTDGRAADIRVVRGIGYGLEERAVETVRGWKFAPGRDAEGRVITVWITIEAVFRLS